MTEIALKKSKQDGTKEKYFFGHPVTVQVKKDCNHLKYAPILSPSSTLSTNIMVIILTLRRRQACALQAAARETNKASDWKAGQAP